MSEASAKFNERRAKIDAAAIHGNPAFGKDQLAALDAQSRVDIAEALTALVGILGDGYEPMGDTPHHDTDEVTPDHNDEAPNLEPGDLVAASNNPTHELGVVVAAGVSEGRSWVQYEDDESELSGKVWADQLIVYTPPKPPETERTNPEDGAELRRKAAKDHMANINDEPKVEYEPASFETSKDGREFDVPIGIVGAPVKVKSKGK